MELPYPSPLGQKRKGAPTCVRAPGLRNLVGELLLPFLGSPFLALLDLFLHSNFLLRLGRGPASTLAIRLAPHIRAVRARVKINRTEKETGYLGAAPA